MQFNRYVQYNVWQDRATSNKWPHTHINKGDQVFRQLIDWQGWSSNLVQYHNLWLKPSCHAQFIFYEYQYWQLKVAWGFLKYNCLSTNALHCYSLYWTLMFMCHCEAERFFGLATFKWLTICAASPKHKTKFNRVKP